MLSFRADPFVGESVKEKYQKLEARIRDGKRVKKGITLIVYAINEKDLFDLLPANEMKFPLRKKQDIYVLGIAGSRKEAMELVQGMVMEVYGRTGGFDVRGYFGGL
ncbi:MAG: hypothetical protein K2O03_05860 [Lachnospiraceae bacterium]|nr:hypothetical protein [Lachnospiraceae bacterium]